MELIRYLEHHFLTREELLDSVAAPFAPHEVARSSRRRYVDEVRAAYGLAPAG